MSLQQSFRLLSFYDATNFTTLQLNERQGPYGSCKKTAHRAAPPPTNTVAIARPAKVIMRKSLGN